MDAFEVDNDLSDPFSMLAGMSSDPDANKEASVAEHEVTQTACQVRGSADENAPQNTPMGEEHSCDELPDCAVAAPWNQVCHPSSLAASLARLLARLRSKGFELPWICRICMSRNERYVGMCEVCKTQNFCYTDAIDFDIAEASMFTVSRTDDHPLLMLARSLGPCEVEACFAFCEAVALERDFPHEAVPCYRRAFRLWPPLDSVLHHEGIPAKLRRAVGTVHAVQFNLPEAICPVLGVGPTRSWVSADTHVSRQPLLKSFDVGGIARYMRERSGHRIVILCGAGISTSAGIPDFRSPGTGLYDNLQKYKLPEPEAVFSLDYFRQSPGAFYDLARELWPGSFSPTACHHFIRLLNDKGMLLRCYTQNIDSLERLAGVPSEKLVAVHGTFDEAHVIDTQADLLVDAAELKAAIDKGEAGWKALRSKWGGLVKPKIVFFGEELPDRFRDLHLNDLASCSLLLVIGTSLAVAPFNSLLAKANPDAPRLLINRQPSGLCDALPGGFRYHLEPKGANWRDVFLEGDADAGIFSLASALGWMSDLEACMEATTQGASVSAA